MSKIRPLKNTSDEDVRKFSLDVASSWPRAIAKSVATAAGRLYLSLIGSSGAGVLELLTQEADAAGVVNGVIQFTDKNSTASDARTVLLNVVLRGSTANKRGGEFRVATKADNGSAPVLRLYVTENGSVVVGDSTNALATNATDGFIYIPSSAGPPSGAPTTQTGTVAMEFDTTNNRLYIRNPTGTPAWVSVQLA